ncbi:hypothetical protein F5B17DRAFT_351608 [Nemania serpens]|nr:hypothetical protein F5B17DRAFT_351608 [Nemania serpens]
MPISSTITNFGVRADDRQTLLTRSSPNSARLAQSVERETLNLKVAGSTPASGSIPDASQLTGSSNPFNFFLILEIKN